MNTEDRILDALNEMRREVQANGVTDKVDELWQHALRLSDMRTRRPSDDQLSDPRDTFGDCTSKVLPALARRQAN